MTRVNLTRSIESRIFITLPGDNTHNIRSGLAEKEVMNTEKFPFMSYDENDEEVPPVLRIFSLSW